MEAHADAYEHGRSSEEDQLVESDATSDIAEDGHCPRPAIPQYPEPHPAPGIQGATSCLPLPSSLPWTSVER